MSIFTTCKQFFLWIISGKCLTIQVEHHFYISQCSSRQNNGFSSSGSFIYNSSNFSSSSYITQCAISQSKIGSCIHPLKGYSQSIQRRYSSVFSDIEYNLAQLMRKLQLRFVCSSFCKSCCIVRIEQVDILRLALVCDINFIYITRQRSCIWIISNKIYRTSVCWIVQSIIRIDSRNISICVCSVLLINSNSRG